MTGQTISVLNTTHYSTDDLAQLVHRSAERGALKRVSTVVFGYEPKKNLAGAAECFWKGGYKVHYDAVRLIVMVPPLDLGNVLPAAVVLGTVGRTPATAPMQVSIDVARALEVTAWGLEQDETELAQLPVLRVSNKRPPKVSTVWSRAKQFVRMERKFSEVSDLTRKYEQIVSGLNKSKLTLHNYLAKLNLDSTADLDSVDPVEVITR